MLALILDSRCAADSAREAIELCIDTLIPVLFPLFVLSAMLVPALGALRMPLLSKILGFPEGGGGLFLIGCAGGFPVGAACVTQAARDSQQEPACQSRRQKRPESDLGVGRIPWRKTWQSTPVLLPGESHGQRSLVGYGP